MQGPVGTRGSEETMLAMAMAMAGEGLSLPLLMLL